MSTPSRVPVTIITGFLGAGKTTLVRHILANAGDLRLALIINEFGDVGVDGSILKGCALDNCPEDNIIELANGCICCTVADDFIPTLDLLLSRTPRPDHIIIETSGLALPKPLVKAFDWPDIRRRVTVDGVIAVVDGPAVLDGRFGEGDHHEAAPLGMDHDNPLEEVFEDQLLAADLVIVNKADLLEDGDFDAVSDTIREHLPRMIKILPATEGKLPMNVLLGLDAQAEDDLDNRPSHHDDEDEHDHEDFDSFIVDIGEVDAPDSLSQKITQLAVRHDVLRVKGFVPVTGKPLKLLVQAVGRRVDLRFDRPFGTDPRHGRLVVIGEKGMDQAAIRRDLIGS